MDIINSGYKNTLSKANDFRCHAVFVLAFYDCVLPPPEAKGS